MHASTADAQATCTGSATSIALKSRKCKLAQAGAIRAVPPINVLASIHMSAQSFRHGQQLLPKIKAQPIPKTILQTCAVTYHSGRLPNVAPSKAFARKSREHRRVELLPTSAREEGGTITESNRADASIHERKHND